MRSKGYWTNQRTFWTDENLARIQATDVRFDGADGTVPDGELTSDEVWAVLRPGGNQPKLLQMQLLATYFNLADRRLNASTTIDSQTSRRLGLSTARDAVEYADGTLELPVNQFTRWQYSNATRVLDEINNKESVRF